MYRTVKTTDKPVSSSGNSRCLVFNISAFSSLFLRRWSYFCFFSSICTLSALHASILYAHTHTHTRASVHSRILWCAFVYNIRDCVCMLLHFIWRFWWVNINLLKGKADGSGEEDMSPIGSYSTANERGGLQRGVQSEGSPVQQDMDYPSSTTTTTLWSNSSRYLCLSLSVPYTFLKGEWWT